MPHEHQGGSLLHGIKHPFRRIQYKGVHQRFVSAIRDAMCEFAVKGDCCLVMDSFDSNQSGDLINDMDRFPVTHVIHELCVQSCFFFILGSHSSTQSLDLVVKSAG